MTVYNWGHDMNTEEEFWEVVEDGLQEGCEKGIWSVQGTHELSF